MARIAWRVRARAVYISVYPMLVRFTMAMYNLLNYKAVNTSATLMYLLICITSASHLQITLYCTVRSYRTNYERTILDKAGVRSNV